MALELHMSSSQNGSNPLRPHPHAGARDAEGNYGYVADVTLVRRWMIDRFCHWKATSVTSSTGTSTGNSHALLRQFLPFDDEIEMKAICDIFPGEGSEGVAGFQLLAEHVRVENSEVEDSIQHEFELRQLQQKKKSDDNENIIDAFFNKAHTLFSPKKVEHRKDSRILCVVYTYI